MKSHVIAIAFLLCSCAFADEPAKQPLTTLKVDVERVVEAGAVRPVDGITSSGQPDAEAFRVFSDSGYAAVIDLRTDTEKRGLDEPAVVEELGMSYVSFPIASADAINFESARQLDELIGAQDGPVLIHCGSGNRVGAMLALIESMKGADDETAISAGREGGMTRLEPLVRRRLEEK